MTHDQDQPTSLPLDNPLWRFSLAVYSAPGVKDECLTAQDTLGADVNVLLYCTWLGAVSGIALDSGAVAGIAGAAEDWSRTAVVPLRAIRRAIKLLPEMEHAEVRAMRESVAAIELRAEQIEQALLFALPLERPAAGLSPSVADIVRGNIAAYLDHLQQRVSAGAGGFQDLVEAAVQFARRLDLDPGRT